MKQFRKPSEDTRQKLSAKESEVNNPMSEKDYSEGTKRLISDMKRYLEENPPKKNGYMNRQFRKPSEDVRQKLNVKESEVNNPMSEKNYSEGTKRLISDMKRYLEENPPKKNGYTFKK